MSCRTKIKINGNQKRNTQRTKLSRNCDEEFSRNYYVCLLLLKAKVVAEETAKHCSKVNDVKKNEILARSLLCVVFRGQ